MACPVTEIPGYRNYVLSSIQSKQVFARLDTEWVAQEEFQTA